MKEGRVEEVECGTAVTNYGAGRQPGWEAGRDYELHVMMAEESMHG